MSTYRRRRLAPAAPKDPGKPAFNYFKKSGPRLFLNEHQGKLWASDHYMMVPVDADGPIAAMLADFNLPAEPMSCEVGRTVKRTDAQPPDLGRILSETTWTQRLTLLTYGQYEVKLEQNGVTYEPWRSSTGEMVVFDPTKRRFVESVTEGAWFAGTTETKPAVRVDDNGQVTALLMPIRTQLGVAYHDWPFEEVAA